jgi:hypothetical protein
MIDRAAAVVAESVDRGFDWGSAAIGAGAGSALTLVLIALVIAVENRIYRRSTTARPPAGTVGASHEPPKEER